MERQPPCRRTARRRRSHGHRAGRTSSVAPPAAPPAAPRQTLDNLAGPRRAHRLDRARRVDRPRARGAGAGGPSVPVDPTRPPPVGRYRPRHRAGPIATAVAFSPPAAADAPPTVARGRRAVSARAGPRRGRPRPRRSRRPGGRGSQDVEAVWRVRRRRHDHDHADAEVEHLGHLLVGDVAEPLDLAEDPRRLPRAAVDAPRRRLRAAPGRGCRGCRRR